MDQTTFQGYHSLLVTTERIVREGTGDKGIRGFKQSNIMFKDIAVLYDAACLANTAYVLNNRNWKFIYMSWMKGEPAVRPSDGFWDVQKVLTIGNCITDNSRRLGVATSCAS